MALVSFGDILMPAEEFNESGATLGQDRVMAIADATAIGIGRPLAIRILSIYTGDPPKHFPGKQPRLLVSSRVKHDSDTGSAPRAINLLTEETGRRKLMQGFLGQGSRVIYYTPAYTGGMLNIGVELVSDTFPDTLFKTVSGMLGAAAALPVFAPAQLALVGASVFSKALNGLEKKLESPPFLVDDDIVNFDVAGAPVRQAGYIVFVNGSHEADLRGKYDVAAVPTLGGAPEIALVDKATNLRYGGDIPYVIAYADGARDPTLEAFAPLQASAALIQSFYRSTDSDGQIAVEVLTQGMSLYNDRRYAERARTEARALSRLTPGTDDYARTLKKLEAYITNVQSDEFRTVVSTFKPAAQPIQ